MNRKNVMRAMAHYVSRQLRDDWDWWTIISGGEGSGKSTLAIWWALYVSGDLFHVRDHVAYDAETFLQLVDSAPRFGTIIADEGGEMWYNRDHMATFNKALAKASQQIRNRNLNVILCVPSLYLLDTAAIRRHKTWAVCSAPGGHRGKSEWYRPIWKRFAKQTSPYWDLKFIHWFDDLPARIKSEYLELKETKDRERIQRYLKKLKEDRQDARGEERTPQDIVADLMQKSEGELDRYRNSRGTIDRDLVKYDYRCTTEVARTVAMRINKDRGLS